MKFLVISQTHHLLPFALRLQREGHDVRPVVAIKQFERAWHGKFEPSPRDKKNEHLLDDAFLSELLAEAVDSDTVVLTDSWPIDKRLREEFSLPAERLYGVGMAGESRPTTPLRLGGWFDGEKLLHPFGISADRGAWIGGQGPDIDGAVTLIRIDTDAGKALVNGLLAEKVSELKAQEFRGVVQFGLEFMESATGEPEVSGVEAGWPMLVTHGFLSETETFGHLLSGSREYQSDHTQTGPLPRKFVTVLPVSRPPWPNRKTKFRFQELPIEGLTPKQMARVFWHDVQVDQQAQQLRTAGLDGLVGVVRGAANTSQLSLALAIETATKLSMPEKQFRLDAGAQVQNVLAHLESRFGLLL